MQILDHGELDLLDSIGSDLAVVRAARVSNGVVGEVLDSDKNARLIKYLMKHRHGTPFEHAVFTFYIKCPIFVAREWMRHRIGSYNEISGRYVEFQPEFYIPKEFRVPTKDNKQGSQYPDDSVPLKNGDVMDKQDWNRYNLKDFEASVMSSYEMYTQLLKRGVAKEMARMVLPLSLYTQFYWTVNARSLMNFLGLRTAPDAQREIQEYAVSIETIFHKSMPFTWEAWNENGRISP